MTFVELVKQVATSGCAGWRFAQRGAHPFCDFLTVYCDGRVLSERYCRGEAAGLAFVLWANGAEQEAFCWDYEACRNTRKKEAPQRLTAAEEAALQLDGRADPWELVERKKTDGAHGYGALKMLLGKRRR